MKDERAKPPETTALDRDFGAIVALSARGRARQRRRRGLAIALPLALVLGAGTLGVLKNEGYLGAIDAVVRPARPATPPVATTSPAAPIAAPPAGRPPPASVVRDADRGADTEDAIVAPPSHREKAVRIADRGAANAASRASPSTHTTTRKTGEDDAAPEDKDRPARKAARLEANDALRTLRLR